MTQQFDDEGNEMLSEEQAEEFEKAMQVPADILRRVFRLGEGSTYSLPQFARRLRTFKAERGL